MAYHVYTAYNHRLKLVFFPIIPLDNLDLQGKFLNDIFLHQWVKNY